MSWSSQKKKEKKIFVAFTLSKGNVFNICVLGMTRKWRPWTFSSFQDPPSPLSIYVQNSSTPLTLNVQLQTNQPPPPPLTPNDNQSIKKRMTIICYYVHSLDQFSFPGSTH